MAESQSGTEEEASTRDLGRAGNRRKHGTGPGQSWSPGGGGDLRYHLHPTSEGRASSDLVGLGLVLQQWDYC